MRTNCHVAQDLCPSTDVDVVPDLRQPVAAFSVANRNLLKYQTIDADPGARMDDNAVGMGNQESTTNVAIERNVRPGDDAPKAMPKDEKLAAHRGKWTALASA